MLTNMSALSASGKQIAELAWFLPVKFGMIREEMKTVKHL